MILQLDDNYRIVSDERNFILQKKANPEKNPRKGKKDKEAGDHWRNIGFWKDLSQLLSAYTRQVLRSKTGKRPRSQHYLVTCELSGKLSSGLVSSV